MIRLYSYFRSTSSYRVRIALNVKDIVYELKSVHLLRDGGQQFSTQYRDLNPQALLPTLDDDGVLLTQSLAIIEYLDEQYPQPALLPSTTRGRAWVRALAQIVACEMHPFNNLRVRRYLSDDLHCDADQQQAWQQHWIHLGFQTIEQHLSQSTHTGQCCYGDEVTIADCCLVPQVYNAIRYQCDLSEYPTIMRIHDHCLALDAFVKAHPDNQPDSD